MPNVLGNGPLPVDLVVRSVLPHSLKQRPESWNGAAKAFDEVREHPRRVHKRERALCPVRPRYACTHEITIPRLANGCVHLQAMFQKASVARLRFCTSKGFKGDGSFRFRKQDTSSVSVRVKTLRPQWKGSLNAPGVAALTRDARVRLSNWHADSKTNAGG